MFSYLLLLQLCLVPTYNSMIKSKYGYNCSNRFTFKHYLFLRGVMVPCTHVSLYHCIMGSWESCIVCTAELVTGGCHFGSNARPAESVRIVAAVNISHGSGASVKEVCDLRINFWSRFASVRFVCRSSWPRA